MRTPTPLAAAMVASILLPMAAACDPCDDDACDAVRTPTKARSIEQGLVGIVAFRSDVGDNGCFPCDPANARIGVWRVASPVLDQAAAESVVKDKPFLVIAARERYEQPLEAGDFLLCVIPGECASVQMASKKVMTLNVQKNYGPSALLVFEPWTARARTGGIFRMPNSAPRF